MEETALGIERSRAFNAINGIGKVFLRLGLNPFRLEAEAIIKAARKNTGSNWPMPAQLEAGLHCLIDSINREAKINTFGSLALKRLFERTLSERFKIEGAFLENPEISSRPIRQPVFIIGMPRTGTTILHALLHQDPAHRSPLAWECLLPHPAASPETYDNNPQLATVTKEFDQLFQLVPDFQRKHHMSAVSPQECLGINAFDFNSFQTAAQVYVPSYMSWFFHGADHESTMRFHKRFLQFLESGGVQGERWLLKSPVHLMRLKALFAVYPDARIIMTHRSPDLVVPSAASLVSSVRSLYSDHEDPHRTGAEQAGIWSQYFARFLDDRKAVNKEDQILDLRFEDFANDHMAVVRSIYHRFGWHLSRTAEAAMVAFLADNPKEKHGEHTYSLEQFGLNKPEIDKQYERYHQFLHTLPH